MSDSDAIEAILVRWEKEREAGRVITIEELCRDHPHLTDRVTNEIRLVEDFSRQMRSRRRLKVDEGPPPTELAGTLVSSRYQLVREIARGGFGTVWLATDITLRRWVAVKLTWPGARTRIAAQSGRQEYDLAARLFHPNVLPVYAAGEHLGYTFVVTTFVQTGTLADLLARGSIRAARAVRIVRDLAKAVECLHDNGVIHRDVNPGNVLLDEVDRPFLIDFGLALRAPAGTPVVPPSDASTFGYMAPEQLELDPRIDHRCDQYAIGIVLYRCLTGRLPFAVRESSADVPRLVDPNATIELPQSVELSIGLDPIIRRCLAYAPNDRYERTAELVADLSNALDLLAGPDRFRDPTEPFKVPDYWPAPKGGVGHEERRGTVKRCAGHAEWVHRHPLLSSLRGRGPRRHIVGATAGASARHLVVRVTTGAAIAALVAMVLGPALGAAKPWVDALVVFGSGAGMVLLAACHWRVAMPAVLFAGVALALWLCRLPFTFWDQISTALGRPLGAR